MLGTRVSYGPFICVAIYALSVYSQATSTAKTLADLEVEVLKVINDNKSAAIPDLIQKIKDQVKASVTSIKSYGGYPSQSDITSAVADLISKLEKNGPIVGDGIQRFQNELTDYLNKDFPPK